PIYWALPKSPLQAHKRHRAPPWRHRTTATPNSAPRVRHLRAAGNEQPSFRNSSPHGRTPVPRSTQRRSPHGFATRDQGQKIRTGRYGAGGAQSEGEEGGRQL